MQKQSKENNFYYKNTKEVEAVKEEEEEIHQKNYHAMSLLTGSYYRNSSSKNRNCSCQIISFHKYPRHQKHHYNMKHHHHCHMPWQHHKQQQKYDKRIIYQRKYQQLPCWIKNLKLLCLGEYLIDNFMLLNKKK